MFKKNIYKYILIVVSVLFLFLTGCNGANPVVSIEVEMQNEENPISFVVGEFSFDDLNLIVSYENGETKVVSITEDMINKDDLIKLYRLGKNEIEIIYGRHKTSIFVYGTYKQFTDIYLNDVVMTYTGEEIKVEVEGNIPDTAQVIYPQGNVYKNVGTYVTKAVIFENGFEVLELTANVVINKAEYDMSSVEFDDAVYTYDGKDKMIFVQGDLPEGVSVSYYVNGLLTNGFSDSGEYEVTAVFSGDDRNYEPIEDKTATLTIKKATHNMDGIKLEDVEFVYDSYLHELKLTNETLLPTGVVAVYKNNQQIEAGTYEVVVEFELEDPNNYSVIEPLTATMVINKAEYDMSDVLLLGQKVKYEDGKTYKLELNKELPSFVKVLYQYFPKLVKGKWNALNIDATEGYWYKGIGEYISVGQGTVVKIEVGNQTIITLDAEYDSNNFDIQIDNGIAIITCINADGLKSITFSNSTGISTTINVSSCDLIFHNENEPLASDVLPSCKGEYIVVVKLIVEDNNYYGEKELTAFLFIE